MLRIDHVMGVQRLWWIPEGCERHRRRVRALPPRGAARRHRRRGRAHVDDDRRREPRHRARGGHRGARALGRLGHVRGAVQPVPPHAPCRRSPPTRSPASAPTTCRRSPPPSTATPPAASTTTGGCVADAVGHPVGDGAADVLDAALERLAGERRLPRRRRPRRPRRRDRAAQRARARCCRRRGGGGCAPPTSAVLADRRRPPPPRAARARRPVKSVTDATSSQPGRRDRSPPVQRGHPPPPAPLPRRPSRRHRHVVRGVGAERRGPSTCSATSTAGRGQQLEPIGGSGIWSRPRRRGARRAVVPLRRHQPPRRADGEGRPRRRGDQRAAVDGIGDRRPRPRVGRRRVDGRPRPAQRTPTRRSRSTRCTSGRGAAIVDARAPLPDATTSSPTRWPTTCWPTASPTSSCCR